MQNFQKYFYEASKLFEFRVKVANVELTKEVMENIRNAIDAYQIETVTEPKRLPIQEHKEFGKLGPCECQVFDVAVRYPTIVEQIRQLIITRAQINADCVCVYTKGQYEQLEEVQDRIDGQKPVLENPTLESDSTGQDLVGEKRNISLLKELETRKYEVAGKEKTDSKSTNDLPQGTTSPVGTNKNTIPAPIKGKK